MAIVVALLVAPYLAAQPADRSGEWRAWAADVGSTRYSPLDQINANTVGRLRIAWRQSATPDVVKAGLASTFPPPGNYQHTPLMVGGLLYDCARDDLSAQRQAVRGRRDRLD